MEETTIMKDRSTHGDYSSHHKEQTGMTRHISSSRHEKNQTIWTKELTGNNSVTEGHTQLPTFREHVARIHPDKQNRYEQLVAGILSTYEELGEVAQAETIIYAASGADAFPILSTDTLIMIDEQPFASTGDEYAEVIRALDADPNKEHTLQEFLNESTMSETTHNSLTYTTNFAHTKLLIYEGTGFQLHALPDTAMHILEDLFILGVNLPDVAIKRDGQNRYRLSFMLNDEPKEIYYLQDTLPQEEGDEFTSTTQAFLRQFDEDHRTERIAVLSKADIHGVSQKIIKQVHPHVIISDDPEVTTDVSEEYLFMPLRKTSSQTKDHGIQFGYQQSLGDVLVGKRF